MSRVPTLLTAESSSHKPAVRNLFRCLQILLLTSVLSPNLLAQEAEKIATPPGTQPSGLTFHDGHFYLSSYKLKPGIYKIRLSDATVVSHFTPNVVWDGRYGGLAASKQGLVHVQANNNSGKSFSLLRFKNGNLVMATQLDVPQDCSDLAINGTTMWLIAGRQSSTDPIPAALFEIDLKRRQVRGKYPIPDRVKNDTDNYGMSFGAGHLYISSGSEVFKLDPKKFDVLESYKVPAQRIESLAWDGKNIWAASFYGGIYCVKP